MYHFFVDFKDVILLLVFKARGFIYFPVSIEFVEMYETIKIWTKKNQVYKFSTQFDFSKSTSIVQY